MSRRSLGSAALAVALLSSGLLPLLGTAHADTCASWTDKKDDATTNNSNQSLLADSNLDIVSASLTTVGSTVVATIGVQKLTNGGYSDYGDQHYLQFKVAGTIVRFVAERNELAEKAYLANAGGTSNGAATVVYDHNASAVRITATQAEVDKSAGKAAAGIEATDLSAGTYNQVNSQQVMTYDSAQAPAGTTYTVGAQCSPVVAPLALSYPQGTCNDVSDIASDGTAVVIGPAAFPNEPTLDISSVAFNSTPDTFYAYLKVATLSAKPTYFQGDRFEAEFKVGTKVFTFATGRYFGAGHSVTSYPTYGEIGGTESTVLKVRGAFDTAKNTVVIMVDRASLDTANGSPVADGTKVTDVVTRTVGLQPGLQFPADTAQATAVTDRVYTMGSGKCFPPPPAVLDNVGRTTAQFTDAAAVAAKLTNAAGAALAGKTVTFTVGSKSVSATTNSGGVASASLNPGLAAGSYSLVTRFAGDSSASEVTTTTPFTVSVEKTKITLKVVKNGAKRTVIATLKDDDGKAIAGQVVTWYVNGKKVSAPKTNGAGSVTLTTAKPTQTVKAVFATVSGKYAGTTAQAKV